MLGDNQVMVEQVEQLADEYNEEMKDAEINDNDDNLEEEYKKRKKQ